MSPKRFRGDRARDESTRCACVDEDHHRARSRARVGASASSSREDAITQTVSFVSLNVREMWRFACERETGQESQTVEIAVETSCFPDPLETRSRSDHSSSASVRLRAVRGGLSSREAHTEARACGGARARGDHASRDGACAPLLRRAATAHTARAAIATSVTTSTREADAADGHCGRRAGRGGLIRACEEICAARGKRTHTTGFHDDGHTPARARCSSSRSPAAR